jgi:hypothetical protein
MRPQDIGLGAVGGFVGILMALILGQTLMKPDSYQKTIEKIDQGISGDFNQPDPKYVNKDALNPSQTITISPGDNQKPFGN